ncbi:putative MPP superfamily phosphohydrolase [Microbacterium halimionae]|uniref:Putative MPP superfamily phosphohydrolase n=1 Tax=Microbacterium halimionae TaxID=1526413 RepID=A0A7W3JME3_9MICO|nr:metallophosphoesterase [Microbacterium halimionae]MBA8815527.1 putative MPP superfamily phosphohydrolase [Microbacterium halimionae]NII95574.1 putative MPP superfamily phosphohydrolase [Microbacterium halimionae]
MTSRSTKVALTALAAVGATGVSTAVWGIGIERYLFTVRTRDVHVLPPGSQPLRVLHISDAHMAPWQHRKQEWIASLAGLKPDLVINTGDNLGHPRGLEGIRGALSAFRGVPGLYVHGSNDLVAPSPRNPLRYFLGPSSHTPAAAPLDTHALDTFLQDELGWRGLNNSTATFRIGDLRINAFGVDDAHRQWDDIPSLAPEIGKLKKRTDLTLGVTHAPYRRVLDAFVDFGANAILAGHTHGGQVRIPGSSKALVANCDIPLDQARGLSSWSHGGTAAPLNVSAGIGHSIYAPVRFGCRPEASLLTLLPRA